MDPGEERSASRRTQPDRATSSAFSASPCEPNPLRLCVILNRLRVTESRGERGEAPSDLTRAREPTDVLRSPERQRLDGHGRLAAAGRHEAAAVADEEVGH